MAETVAQLTFDGETLRYTPPDKLGWDVTLEKIVAVGESTFGDADRGVEPTFCVVNRRGVCLTVPMKVPGFQAAITALGLAMHSSLKCKYVKAKGYESRVIMPRNMRDKPLLEFEQQSPQGIIGRLFQSPAVEKRLTSEIKELAEKEAIKAAASKPTTPAAAKSNAKTGVPRDTPPKTAKR